MAQPALPTPNDIYLDYPVFENEPPSRIQRFIDRAIARLDEGDWCNPHEYVTAVEMLALHMLTLNPTPVDASDTTNPIAALGIDPAAIKTIDVDDEYSITLHSPKDMGAVGFAGSNGDGTLNSTRFGRAFLELESRRCKRLKFGQDDCDRHLTETAQKYDAFNHFTDAYL